MPIYADVGDQVSAGITTIKNMVLKIVNPLLILIVIICGIMYAVSRDPKQSEMAKSWGIRILIGAIIINVASQIVDWLQTLGK